MPKEKASRVDGFSIEFFINCWEVVKSDLVNAILPFFNTSEMDMAINCTTVTLFPKVPALTHVKEYKFLVVLLCARSSLNF